MKNYTKDEYWAKIDELKKKNEDEDINVYWLRSQKLADDLMDDKIGLHILLPEETDEVIEQLFRNHVCNNY